jgi:hypothetical protein
LFRGRKRRIRALVAVFSFIILGGVLAGQLPASATTGVDGFTVLYATRGNVAHHCQVIGGANGYQAVICEDLLTGASDGEYYVEGQIEAYCQTTSGAPVKCAAITAGGVLGQGANPPDPTGWVNCGAAAGATQACPGGRLDVQTVPYWYSSTTGCDSYPNSNFDVWMVAEAYDVGINVPGGGQTFFANTQGYETGHYYICY